jgi:hypothetical protein
MIKKYRPSAIPIHSDLFVRKIFPETLSAWVPFADCVGMNFELQNSDIDEEHPEWRMHWTFAVVMLRTVGHVLVKVDRHKSARHKQTIDAYWTRWKGDRLANWIFWEFIEDERNNILKTYKFGVEINEEGLWHSGLAEDGVQLIREAAYWWRNQLEGIEKELAE